MMSNSSALTTQLEYLRQIIPLLADLGTRTTSSLNDRHPVDIASSTRDAIHALKVQLCAPLYTRSNQLLMCLVVPCNNRN
jgi:hypothetical protein